MKRRAPANILLHRAQLVALLAAIVPTILTIALGIVLLANRGSQAVSGVAGVLVLVFCAASIVGYFIASILLRRSVSLVDLQNRFLATVSHELRTPMTSIRMFVDALLDDRLTDDVERKRCLQKLQRELVRLDELVGRLLDLSRVESSRIERVRLSVEELVEAAMVAFDVLRLHENADVHVDVERGLFVNGDRAALTLALVNLLSNAWKHGPPGARIEFRAAARGTREVVFEVHDEGPGIPAEERASIFEMFERGRASLAGVSVGSGIGLAVVEAIASEHGGRVELLPEEDSGVTFRLTLPRELGTHQSVDAPSPAQALAP